MLLKINKEMSEKFINSRIFNILVLKKKQRDMLCNKSINKISEFRTGLTHYRVAPDFKKSSLKSFIF